MLRITQTNTPVGIELALDGKLLEPWTNEVRIAAASALARGHVQLELARLSFADSAGIATLRSLRSAGIRFMHCSPFIDGLLQLPEATE
jgi:ABC-type transporter Mla MlaB component